MKKICKSCKKSISEDFAVCPYCGYNEETISSKNGYICLWLCIFLGFFAAHRFYAGRLISASILYALNLIALSTINIFNYLRVLPYVFGLFYFGFYFIWWVIDLILMISGKFKDSKGRYIKIKD